MLGALNFILAQGPCKAKSCTVWKSDIATLIAMMGVQEAKPPEAQLKKKIVMTPNWIF